MSDPTVFPYTPARPPDGSDEALGRWAFNELQDVSDWLGVRPDPLAALAGVASAMTVDATRRIITGYPIEYEGEGFRDTADPATGVITLPFTGLYEITAHIGGTHAVATQNDAAIGFLRTPGGDMDFTAWPIATNKITGLYMNGSLLLPGNQGDTWSLGLYATVSLGTFTFVSSEFLVKLSTVG